MTHDLTSGAEDENLPTGADSARLMLTLDDEAIIPRIFIFLSRRGGKYP